MVPSMPHPQQAAFAAAVASLLRQSRRRQHLTQSEVATRTGGSISKAALANYEAGHRSLRIDVFWAIARALGEDAAALLTTAERTSGYRTETEQAPITVRVDAIQESTDPLLVPVRRWFALRLRPGADNVSADSITLNFGAQSALAELIGLTSIECRRLLSAIDTAHQDTWHSLPACHEGDA
ncbi:MAG: helix-turn-helix transcriptional regulator [Nakamurella sp.]